MAHRVRGVIGASPVLLLTATPIQNSLCELWGLVQYVDPSGTLLEDKPVFEDICADDGRGVAGYQAEELRGRLTTVVQRASRLRGMVGEGDVGETATESTRDQRLG